MPDSTIKDVARLAGVSIATVSRVMNGNYYVSPAVEKKVRDAVAELNYYPNSVARSLKKEITHTIGIVVSDISNNYFTAMARAVEDVVSGQNYNIIMCSTEDDASREQSQLRMLAARRIDGLILNTTGKNDGYIASLSAGMPVVTVNRRIGGRDFTGDFVDSNNAAGVHELVSFLASHGHTRIGVINGDLSVSTGRERFEGFVAAMGHIGVNAGADYPYRFDGLFTEESGYKGASRLMSLSVPPTAVIVMNNAMAIGALKFFRSKNIRIPGDISVAAYGNIDNMDVMFVQPCIVTLDAHAVGTRAGNMLLDRIKTRSLPNREFIFSPALVAGNSVRQLGGNNK